MTVQQSRRVFLQGGVGAGVAGAVAAAGLLPPRAAAQRPPFRLKYASSLPDTHPLNVRVRQAAAAIRQASAGQVELSLFTHGQLGGDTDMLSQLRAGGIDFFPVPGAILSMLVPVAGIDSLGYAFRDYAQVWAALDGALGAHIRGAIGRTGLVALERIWDNGFRQITSSSHPVAAPADLAGFRIRVPASTLWTSMFKALGAAPISINFNEVYTALQTRVVEGQENPLAIIRASRFNEVQTYCSTTAHMWSGFWFLANGASWAALPPALRALVASHIDAAALAQRQDVAALNAGLETELAARGLRFNRPDPAPFRAALRRAGFYAAWRRKYGEAAWALLERYTGPLA
jgi:tripartite ATP-independent transporter DctP family solute receptor